MLVINLIKCGQIGSYIQELLILYSSSQEDAPEFVFFLCAFVVNFVVSEEPDMLTFEFNDIFRLSLINYYCLQFLFFECQ